MHAFTAAFSFCYLETTQEPAKHSKTPWIVKSTVCNSAAKNEATVDTSCGKMTRLTREAYCTGWLRNPFCCDKKTSNVEPARAFLEWRQRRSGSQKNYRFILGPKTHSQPHSNILGVWAWQTWTKWCNNLSWKHRHDPCTTELQWMSEKWETDIRKKYYTSNWTGQPCTIVGYRLGLKCWTCWFCWNVCC